MAKIHPLPGVPFEDRVAQLIKYEKQRIADEELFVIHCQEYIKSHPLPNMSYEYQFDQLINSTRERRGFFQELEYQRINEIIYCNI